MKPGPGSWLATAALLATAPAATGQNYTLEPIGFLSLAGTSTDGNFQVGGSLGYPFPEPLRGDAFTVIGEFRSLVEASFLGPIPTLNNGDFEQSAGGMTPDTNGFLLLWPPPPDENLLPHGDAEGIQGSDGTQKVPIPGWNIVGDLTVTRWNTPGEIGRAHV